MEIFYGILAAITLSIVLTFFQNRKKSDSWSGTVIKIKERLGNYNKDPEYISSDDYNGIKCKLILSQSQVGRNVQ